MAVATLVCRVSGPAAAELSSGWRSATAGRCVLGAPRPEHRHVTVRAFGLAETSREVTIPRAGEGDVVVVMRRLPPGRVGAGPTELRQTAPPPASPGRGPATIQVIMPDGSATPASEALVECQFRARPRFPQAGESSAIRAAVGQNGELYCPSLWNDCRQITITTVAGHCRFSSPADLPRPTGSSCPFARLSPPPTTHGRLVADGVRLPTTGAFAVLTRDPGAPLTVPDPKGPWGEPTDTIRTVPVPPDGLFAAESAVPADARWRVYLSCPGAVSPPVLAQLTPGETRQVDLFVGRPGRIVGKVVSRGARGRVSVPVRGWLGDDEAAPLCRLPFDCRTEDRGRIRIGGLPRGRWHLRCVAAGEWAVAEVQVQPGRTTKAEYGYRPLTAPRS